MGYGWIRSKEISSQTINLKIRIILVLCGVLGLTSLGGSNLRADPSRTGETVGLSFTPTFDYWVVDLNGWKLYVHPSIFERPKQWADFVALMSEKLNQVRRLLPQDSYIQTMQSTIFWVESFNEVLPDSSFVYHLSEDWLKAYGQNPDKSGHIEIANIDKALERFGKDKNTVIHEVIHAFHHKIIPKELADAVNSIYLQVLAEGRYQSVPYREGGYRRAIASFNKWAYFAELTEAYLGENDYYPFSRGDIASYDPAIYPILAQIYGY